MSFFDEIFNKDIIWILLLLFLVCILPQRCSEPIIKNKGLKEESDQCGKEDIECGKDSKDIIYRKAKSQKERRRLVY
ncbi:hypothetical protein [Lutispora saccharofermentans]|uniref:Uncharacterized protein n=1 Tax=Lutispora saccharofermentans TaxID=3024236 RepID=A0ABT1NJF0_9FIRM|nr:hypothetical protein [Lutispora saccharofermentans]MCQ1530011.1 hypothetical protein [Lutispora saccharofermentans]